jgi:hypothetical protein
MEFFRKKFLHSPIFVFGVDVKLERVKRKYEKVQSKKSFIENDLTFLYIDTISD